MVVRLLNHISTCVSLGLNIAALVLVIMVSVAYLGGGGGAQGARAPLSRMNTIKNDNKFTCPAISDIHTRLYIENACKVFDCFKFLTQLD